MARSSTSKLLMLGGLGLGAAWMGLLGADAKRKVQEIFHGAGVATGPSSPFFPGGGGGGGQPGVLPSDYYNPNFGAVANQWRRERAAHGEDPRDWNALVRHLRDIGFGDYGPLGPPAGW